MKMIDFPNMDPYLVFYKQVAKELEIDISKIDVSNIKVTKEAEEILDKQVETWVASQFPYLDPKSKKFQSTIGMHKLCYGPGVISEEELTKELEKEGDTEDEIDNFKVYAHKFVYVTSDGK